MIMDAFYETIMYPLQTACTNMVAMGELKCMGYKDRCATKYLMQQFKCIMCKSSVKFEAQI